MKARVVLMYCQVKLRNVYVVQKWHDVEGWESVRDFEINEVPKARELAQHMSFDRYEPLVCFEFDNGKPL